MLTASQNTDASRIARIAIFVLSVHVALILWMALIAPKPLPPPSKQRVVVHTVQLNAPKPKTASRQIEEVPAPVIESLPVIEEMPQIEIETMPRLEEKPERAPLTEIKLDVPKPKKPEKPKAEVQEKASAPAKKIEKKKPEVKKTVPKKKASPKTKDSKAPPVTKASPETPKPKTPVKDSAKEKSAAIAEKETAKKAAQKARQQELVAKAQESIAKIRPGGVKIGANQTGRAAELKIPQLTLATISTEDASELSVGELSYRDELASRLKLLLKLPEFGSVALKLTLQRSGKVGKVAIQSAASPQNRAYVEKLMPTLQFPPFGSHFGLEPEYTFNITLNNDF